MVVFAASLVAFAYVPPASGEVPRPPGDAARAYELVSPADKVGGQGVGIWYSSPAAAGTAGLPAHTAERFAVHGTWGVVLGDGAFSFADDYSLAERAPEGWTHAPSATRPAYGNHDYRFFSIQTSSDDLSTTTWNANGGSVVLFPEMVDLGFNPGATANPLYLRDWESGHWDLFGPTRLTPSQYPTFGLPGRGPLSVSAVASDGSRAVASGPVRGLEGPGDPTLVAGALNDVGVGSVYLFDVSEGLSDRFPTLADSRRILVNECTAGTLVPAATAGAPSKVSQQPCPGGAGSLISRRGGSLGAGGTKLERTISTDGSRVFFMSPNPSPSGGSSPPVFCAGTGAGTDCGPQLYVRERLDGGGVETRWVSRSEVAGQDASLLGPAIFEGASRDGDRVFFRSISPLTAGDPNGGCGGSPPPCTTGSADSGSSDLFMFDFTDDRGDDPAAGDLTRVSGGPGDGGDCNSPLSPGGANNPSPSLGLRFVSDDGSRAYFTCQRPLGGVAGGPAGGITSAAPAGDSETNLYLYENVGGVQSWKFVARIPRAVTGQIAGCASTASGRGNSLGAGGGRSDTSLAASSGNCWRGTADGSFVTFWTDGALAAGDPDAVSGDVYAFDAAAYSLTRISASQGGVGGSYVCNPADGVADRRPCHGDPGIGDEAQEALPMLGVVSDPPVVGQRTAFFQSKSRLVLGDVDESYDVYMWRDGQLSLLSSGNSEHGATYRGNDVTGRNVYLATLDSLTWQDHDDALDVYSARVGDGIPEPTPPPAPCVVLAGACQGAGAAPVGVAAPATRRAGGADAVSGLRARLVVGSLSRRALARAARTGVLVVRVRVNRAGRVRAVARGRIAGRLRRVGGARRRLAGAGAARLSVRLSGRARRALRSRAALKLGLVVRFDGARPRSRSFVLRRAGR